MKTITEREHILLSRVLKSAHIIKVPGERVPNTCHVALGTIDCEHVQNLLSKGFLRQVDPYQPFKYGFYVAVTEQGAAEIGEELPIITS